MSHYINEVKSTISLYYHLTSVSGAEAIALPYLTNSVNRYNEVSIDKFNDIKLPDNFELSQALKLLMYLYEEYYHAEITIGMI